MPMAKRMNTVFRPKYPRSVEDGQDTMQMFPNLLLLYDTHKIRGQYRYQYKKKYLTRNQLLLKIPIDVFDHGAMLSIHYQRKLRIA